jgi:hypothetical protein
MGRLHCQFKLPCHHSASRRHHPTHLHPPPPAITSGPAPLFVTSLGRSGSTALIAALASDPAVTAPETYPFETKPLAYALHMARLAVSPSIPHLPISSQQFLDVPFVGSTNPNLNHADYPHLFAHYRANGLTIFRSLVKAALTAQPAPNDTNPRYIAEKSAANTMTPMLAELVWPNTIELILCRDITAWIASALAFSRATNRYFGNITDVATVIPQITTDLTSFLDYIASRAEKAIFIRFETLIADRDFPSRLCERLGLTEASAMSASIANVPESHSTIPQINDPILARIIAVPKIKKLITSFTEITTDPSVSFI